MFLFTEPDSISPEVYCSKPDCMTPHVDFGLVMELANDMPEDISDSADELWGFYCFAWLFERVIYADCVDDVAGLLGA